jgi:hypothetical protein
MTKKTDQRKTIQVGSKRIPLNKLLHGKEIREAAKALEDFRLKLNEEEFLYGAKLINFFDISRHSLVNYAKITFRIFVC